MGRLFLKYVMKVNLTTWDTESSRWKVIKLYFEIQSIFKIAESHNSLIQFGTG